MSSLLVFKLGADSQRLLVEDLWVIYHQPSCLLLHTATHVIVNILIGHLNLYMWGSKSSNPPACCNLVPPKFENWPAIFQSINAESYHHNCTMMENKYSYSYS